MRSRTVVALAIMGAVAAVAAPGKARDAGPVLHEPIPPDPVEDQAMHAAGRKLPAAVAASTDDAKHVGTAGRELPHAAPGSEPTDAEPGAALFEPDRDTRRPTVSRYTDPFVPSNAPYKRSLALDLVHEDGTMAVRDPRLAPLASETALDPGDRVFTGDLTIDLPGDAPVRVPTVGPGAHVLHARLIVAGRDIPFHLLHDGADNWFVAPDAAAPMQRGRLLLEIAIARDAFEPSPRDPSWGALPPVPPLPASVARDAEIVAAAVGISRRMRPRAVVEKLTAYFRGFVDSDVPPEPRGSVYLDLALARKGVCRHRAFAFVVTAQSVGILSRLVTNEAHAWVETHDGERWRRIDLGGAGDIVETETAAGQTLSTDTPPAASDDDDGEPANAPADDDRPASKLVLHVDAPEARRGDPLHLFGVMRADGEACPYAPIDVWLRDPVTRRRAHLGTLATDAAGAFDSSIVVPASFAVGDYDIIAHSPGAGRCGEGGN